MKVLLFFYLSFFGHSAYYPFIPSGELERKGQFEFTGIFPMGFSFGLHDRLNVYLYNLELGSPEGDYLYWKSVGFKVAPFVADNVSLITGLGYHSLGMSFLFMAGEVDALALHFEPVIKYKNIYLDTNVDLFQSLQEGDLATIYSMGIFYKLKAIFTAQINYGGENPLIYLGAIAPSEPKRFWLEFGIRIYPAEERAGLNLRLGLYFPKRK